MAKEEEFEHLKKYEKKSKEAENMITHKIGRAHV